MDSGKKVLAALILPLVLVLWFLVAGLDSNQPTNITSTTLQSNITVELNETVNASAPVGINIKLDWSLVIIGVVVLAFIGVLYRIYGSKREGVGHYNDVEITKMLREYALEQFHFQRIAIVKTNRTPKYKPKIVRIKFRVLKPPRHSINYNYIEFTNGVFQDVALNISDHECERLMREGRLIRPSSIPVKTVTMEKRLKKLEKKDDD